jgi:hypothetical protein
MSHIEASTARDVGSIEMTKQQIDEYQQRLAQSIKQRAPPELLDLSEKTWLTALS